jgi:arginine deiminase
MAVHVTSEIGILKSVLVHPPGSELYAVTPATREAYLYDDIIDVAAAQREHRRFVAILERFAEVSYVHDLLSEVLGDSEVRETLIKDTLDFLPSLPIVRELNEMTPAELASALIEGREESPGPLLLRSTRAAMPFRRFQIFSSREMSPLVSTSTS